MSNQMSESDILYQEKNNTGTAWTRNENFDKNGYLIIQNLYNSEDLYHPLPKERGVVRYYGKNIDQFSIDPKEQSEDSQTDEVLLRYWHPQYRQIHTEIRIKLEEILGRKLYNTYYCDNFYFVGESEPLRLEHESGEICVSIHISTNLEGEDSKWPLWIKTPDTYSDKNKNQILVSGEYLPIILDSGDAIVYKGCERPHYRDPLPGTNNTKMLFGREVTLYYHQIFFYYVLQDGQRSHYASHPPKT